jgi:CheY-like chemotaxis protein
MDVSMPDPGRLRAGRDHPQHPRYQKTAIIFVSAVHLTDLDRLKGYQSGAVDYVSVPVIPELLRAKVRVFAELYRKTREAERLNRELEGRVAERTAALVAAAARQSELTEELRRANRRKGRIPGVPRARAAQPSGADHQCRQHHAAQGGNDPELNWCRELIERQAGQLTRLVDDLLDVSRIHAGRHHPAQGTGVDRLDRLHRRRELPPVDRPAPPQAHRRASRSCARRRRRPGPAHPEPR